MRPDPPRRREDQGRVRPAAPRDVPPAHRVPAEQGRRDRVAARNGDQRGGVKPVYVGRWRVDPLVRDGVTATGPLPIAVSALARAIARALDAAGAPAPASIGLVLADDAELERLNE